MAKAGFYVVPRQHLIKNISYFVFLLRGCFNWLDKYEPIQDWRCYLSYHATFWRKV